MPQGKGAPSGTGSRASTEPQERLDRPGFDPSRVAEGLHRWAAYYENRARCLANIRSDFLQTAALTLRVVAVEIEKALRDSDRNPEGRDGAARLGAEHESAGLKEASPEPIRETPNATR